MRTWCSVGTSAELHTLDGHAVMKRREVVGLLAGIQAGAISTTQWRAWADRWIIESEVVPAWLFDLSNTTKPTAALALLSEGAESKEVSSEQVDETSIHLGFLYLRHERGEIDTSELLHRAGRLTDAANYDDPTCEAFYLLINEIDRGGPTRPIPQSFATRVANAFAHHVGATRALIAAFAVQPGVAPAGASPRR